MRSIPAFNQVVKGCVLAALFCLAASSTAWAAPEAQYYLGVTRYRRDPEGNELLHQWAMLRAKYPESEFRLKQSFKEMP